MTRKAANVVFPDRLGPSKAKAVPGSTLRVSLSRACTLPKRPLTCSARTEALQSDECLTVQGNTECEQGLSHRGSHRPYRIRMFRCCQDHHAIGGNLLNGFRSCWHGNGFHSIRLLAAVQVATYLGNAGVITHACGRILIVAGLARD